MPLSHHFHPPHGASLKGQAVVQFQRQFPLHLAEVGRAGQHNKARRLLPQSNLLSVYPLVNLFGPPHRPRLLGPQLKLTCVARGSCVAYEEQEKIPLGMQRPRQMKAALYQPMEHSRRVPTQYSTPSNSPRKVRQ